MSIATATVRESRRLLVEALKNVRPESSEMTLADLLAAIRQSGASVPKTEHSGEIADLDQLGAALESDSIDTLEDLAAAIGSGGDEQVSDGDTFSDSRKWRTGKFSLVRELR